jgi:L-alanine-DL-glutamate epimerase-like enolase superfamily enzyme
VAVAAVDLPDRMSLNPRVALGTSISMSQSLHLSYEFLDLNTRHPFVIARGGASGWRTVWVRLRDSEGVEGWGEAAPNRFYGETAETVAVALEVLRPLIESFDPHDLEGAEQAMEKALRFNASARSAVSAALHDLVAKRLGVPLYRLWGLNPARAPRSSFTIGIADDETLRKRVEEAGPYPILKVKLGTDRDRDILHVIRKAAPDKTLRVDANAAWTPRQAVRMAEILHDYDVEFLEQPLPAQDIEGLRFVRERSPIPVIADESCLTSKDVARLAGVVDGVNLKLAKCGGLREALKIITTARAHGMLVMAGCMIESSLGIGAAAHLASLLDFADLDGAALLSNDPFSGVSIDEGRIAVSDAPGIGVERRA